MTAFRTPPKPHPAGEAIRKRLIRAVHAAAMKNGIGDEARKDLQLRVTGKASCRDMTAADLNRVLDAINGGQRPAGGRPAAGKARALWWSLYWLGAVREPSPEALSAFVRRQTGVARIEWLTHVEGHRVIEALKDWCAREGVVWPSGGDEIDDRKAVADAIWDKLVGAGRVRPETRLDGLLHYRISGSSRTWNARQWDEAIRIVGRMWRGHHFGNGNHHGGMDGTE